MVMVMVMVMDLDKVYEEPDDKEGDGAQDVEEGELLPCPHLGSNTKLYLEAQFYINHTNCISFYLFSSLSVNGRKNS